MTDRIEESTPPDVVVDPVVAVNEEQVPDVDSLFEYPDGHRGSSALIQRPPPPPQNFGSFDGRLLAVVSVVVWRDNGSMVRLDVEDEIGSGVEGPVEKAASYVALALCKYKVAIENRFDDTMEVLARPE